MLEIHLPEVETFDSELDEFITLPALRLELEHSLVSISKWESEHEKPFLTADEKSEQEVMDYVYAMIITPGISRGVLTRLDDDILTRINQYINAKRTATWFPESQGASRSRETITSELVYYWMTANNIPAEYQYWHLNRLFTLLRVCAVKQEKPKKVNSAEAAARRRELNEKRRAQMQTSG